MKTVIPTIVISQLFCTSLWFAGNSVISDLATDLNLDESFLAHITSAIQFGFITGTLVFAIFTVSDRYSPSLVFFISAILAGLFNLGICITDIGSTEILFYRFLTGFFLAGIYPVGMKIASDYHQKGLGRTLGFLVGALVIGTAFPHLLKSFVASFPWKYVLYFTSGLSFIGGLSVFLFVPDGPYRKSGSGIKVTAFMDGFKDHKFRSVAFGYFGHMWELYTFWAFVPLMLSSYNSYYSGTNFNVPLLSFFIIASGGLACIISGVISSRYGAKKIAYASLLISGICCVTSPLFLFSSSPYIFIAFLFIWGLSVIADSPLFSTLVAQYAPEDSRGTALTIVTCIGFSITIISIQLINLLSENISGQYIYILLAIGPLLGALALRRSKEPSFNLR